MSPFPDDETELKEDNVPRVTQPWEYQNAGCVFRHLFLFAVIIPFVDSASPWSANPLQVILTERGP